MAEKKDEASEETKNDSKEPANPPATDNGTTNKDDKAPEKTETSDDDTALETKIRNIIKDVIGEGKPANSEDRRRANVEEIAAAAVERASAILEHKKDHDELKEKKDKPVVEVPPVKTPFLRRVLWGPEDAK